MHAGTKSTKCRVSPREWSLHCIALRCAVLYYTALHAAHAAQGELTKSSARGSSFTPSCFSNSSFPTYCPGTSQANGARAAPPSRMNSCCGATSLLPCATGMNAAVLSSCACLALRPSRSKCSRIFDVRSAMGSRLSGQEASRSSPPSAPTYRNSGRQCWCMAACFLVQVRPSEN